MANYFKRILCAAALVGVTTLVTTQVVSKQQDEGMPDMAEMMEAWAKVAQPGKEHKILAEYEGTWTLDMSHWMYPGAEAMKSKSIAKYRPLLGGRFMMEEVIGTMDMGMGEQVFEGMAVFGFDNHTKKHIYVWCDNMGTMMMTAEGEADRSGKVITYFSSFPDPSTGKTMDVKSVSRLISKDKLVFEMHAKQEDGTWFKNAEITGNRAQ